MFDDKSGECIPILAPKTVSAREALLSQLVKGQTALKKPEPVRKIVDSEPLDLMKLIKARPQLKPAGSRIINQPQLAPRKLTAQEQLMTGIKQGKKLKHFSPTEKNIIKEIQKNLEQIKIN